MNCYIHGSVSAVGVCKSCMKGLCHECAQEVEASLSCKGHCEGRVELLNRQAASQSYVSQFRFWLPIMTILYGTYLAVSWSGLFNYPREPWLLLIGIVFISFGVAVLFKNKRSRKTE